MNGIWKIAVVTLLVVALGIVITIKQQGKTSADAVQVVPEPTGKMPRLVDFGANKCVPCKMMVPVLEELTSEYKDRLEVIFVDVWVNPKEAARFNITTIPTQVFFDASGKELYRHEAYFSKEDILAKWKELGINL